jgi:site-specific DNA-methyltransferase (adenine-specific)
MNEFLNTTTCGDCLDLLPRLPACSVNMVLCDLPYGTTQNKWDSVIPFEPLWAQYRRVLRPSGAAVLTCAQPFTSALVVSNQPDFKYCWTWVKDRKSNSLNAKRMPMTGHEDIAVFGKGQITYNPQFVSREKPIAKKTGVFTGKGYGAVNSVGYERRTDTICPDTALYFPVERGFHPTQKPVPLFEYLIRTYTNPGDTVLDNCCGSGTTGLACQNTGRNFIQFELDPGYCEVARGRLRPAMPPANTEGESLSL